VFRKILLAYDGSAGAKRALNVAIELARTCGAELWALAVEERLPHLAATVGKMEEAKEFANHFFHEALSAAYLRAKCRPVTRRAPSLNSAAREASTWWCSAAVGIPGPG
jgi:nucleotide-binding universal stress UspA family protein